MADTAVRTYVLDTSVLLPDPRAMLRLAEHEVVLPPVAVVELEAERDHPEVGYFTRTGLRLLDDLRRTHGRLDGPVPVGSDGGTLRVEPNHVDPSALLAGLRLGDDDRRRRGGDRADGASPLRARDADAFRALSRRRPRDRAPGGRRAVR